MFISKNWITVKFPGYVSLKPTHIFEDQHKAESLIFENFLIPQQCYNCSTACPSDTEANIKLP